MTETGKKSIGITLCVGAVYFFSYALQYLGANYLSVYLARLPFGTNTLVGTAAALGALITALVQPLWGSAADRAKARSRILALTLGLSAGTTLLFLLPVKTSLLALVLVAIFYVPFYAPQSLADAVAVEQRENVCLPFSSLRAFASVGFACMGLVFAVLGDVTDKTAFPMAAVCGAAAMAAALCLPGRQKTTIKTKEKHNVRDALRSKPLRRFLGYSFCLFFLSAWFTTFLPVFIGTDRGLGLTSGSVGVYIAIATAVEAGLLVSCAKKFAAMPVWLVFLLPPAAGVLECVFLSVTGGGVTLYLAAILEGVRCAPMWARSAPYIASLLPEDCTATATGLWTLVTFGAARGLGALCAGILGDVLNLRWMFALCAAGLLAVSLVFPALLKKN